MRTITNKYPAAVAALAAGALLVPATADAREPVTSARAFAAAQQLAGQTATQLEHLSNGAARFDRSRTSVGNYMSYSKFRKGASFALFGTNTVNGVTRTLWCVGNIEVVQAPGGRARVAANVTCPVS